MRSVALALVAMTSTASAGTYLGFGLGTAPATSTSTENMYMESEGRSGRGLVGYRFGRLSVEGSVGRYGLFVNYNDYEFNSTQLGVGGKLNVPIGHNFEIFGRAGLQRSYLTSTRPNDVYNASGSGYYLGAGVEYRVDLTAAAGSVFLDYQFADTSLANSRDMTFDASNRMWTMGVTLSL